MKFVRILAVCALGAAMVSGAAYAGSDEDGDAGAAPNREMYMKMANERHEMSKELMTMLRETMQIVQKLDHHPSAAEKEKLGKMIARMDEIVKRQDEMREEHMNMRKEKMMMRDNKNPCGGRMMQHKGME